ncbi:MAG: GUN4 domain-containing protein [Geitlerinemataceae cyanobacterium]
MLLAFAIGLAIGSFWRMRWMVFDTSHLERHLAAGDFHKADVETSRLLGIAIRTHTNRHRSQWASLLDTLFQAIKSQVLLEVGLPCAELRAIDELWLEHSQGQYGFFVQMNRVLAIARIHPASEESPEDSDRLVDRLAWNDNEAEYFLSWSTLRHRYHVSVFQDSGYIQEVDFPLSRGFYPTPLWYYQSKAAGKFRYGMHRALKDMARCYQDEIAETLEQTPGIDENAPRELIVW